MLTTDPSAAFALDTQALGQLKAKSREQPEEALKLAAQQFEAVFLNMMLKSMRDTTSNDSLFDSEHSRMFVGMMDQQLAQKMATRGIGLADMMLQQLGADLSAAPEHVLNTQLPPAVDAVHYLQTAMPVADWAISLDKLNATQQDFVNRLLPDVMRVSKETGVSPQLMMGQAALESGWGKHEIRHADGSSSHNLFGIKATTGWSGKVAEVMTTEYRHGVAHQQIEPFRAYDSYADALRDYARLISENPRYQKVMQQQHPDNMAREVQRAGYATDPRYADKLIGVMSMMRPVL